MRAQIVEFLRPREDGCDLGRRVLAGDVPCQTHLLVFEEFLVERSEYARGADVVIFGGVDECRGAEIRPHGQHGERFKPNDPDPRVPEVA